MTALGAIRISEPFCRSRRVALGHQFDDQGSPCPPSTDHIWSDSGIICVPVEFRMQSRGASRDRLNYLSIRICHLGILG